MKRIIICADGTWNRPEQLHKDDYPTNVLKFARGIAPHDAKGIKQVVFYDWGIGSYHDKITGGGLGTGLEKMLWTVTASWFITMNRVMKYIYSVSAVAPIP